MFEVSVQDSLNRLEISMDSGFYAQLTLDLDRTGSVLVTQLCLILPNCLKRVYPGARETLEVVLAHRLYLGWCRPDAAQLRADAKAGGDLAERRWC